MSIWSLWKSYQHLRQWMAIYNDFVEGYESSMTMVEIAKRNDVSERTIYRYKAYYDQMKKNNELKEPDFTGENEFMNKEK